MRRAILAFTAISLAGCGDVLSPNAAALSFQGTVTSEASGQPVSGAHVALTDPVILYGERASTTTDAQGHYTLAYSLDNCVAGTLGIALGASATGFVEKTYQASCTASVQQVDFSLATAP